MKKSISLMFIVTLMTTTISFGKQIPNGTWKQTSSTVGDCPNCAISMKKVAPHMLEIISNNDWVGYAYYIQNKDMYKGAMEWKSGKGGVYGNHVFLIKLTYEGATLTMHAQGTKKDFSVTYRKK